VPAQGRAETTPGCVSGKARFGYGVPEMPQVAMPPTADVSTDPSTWERGIWWRRLFLGALTIVVLAGLLGVFGVRSRTVSARSRSGRVDLDVTYAQSARAGLDVPFDIEVHRDGGFHGDVVLSISSDYLSLFNRSSVDPQPDSETSTSHNVRWRYDRPPGDTFVVTVDMEVQQGRHWGRSGRVAVLDGAGHTLAHASFRTWLAP
jgi:hypothetical protein